ncbi:hypothetical protein ACFXCR_06495 [Streptomyces sp. NPDC059431]|uniref:hypothetical protein n=1 Tax=Streptomyces sp. NPDC059431 TaxID=3346828 RepID=UPI0036BFB6DA
MSGRGPVLLPPGTGEWPQEARDPVALVVSVARDGHVSCVFVARPEHAFGRDPFRGYVVEAADPLFGRPDVDGLVRAMHRGSAPSRGITVTTLQLKGGALRGLGTVEPPAEAAVLRAGELATGVDLTLARAVLAAGAEPPVGGRPRGAGSTTPPTSTRPGGRPPAPPPGPGSGSCIRGEVSPWTACGSSRPISQEASGRSNSSPGEVSS